MTSDASTTVASSAAATRAPSSSVARTLLLGAAAVVVATAANLIVATAALAAGADARFMPLSAPLVAGFTAAGVIAALVGWRIITARVRGSRRVLTWLVPTLLVLSLVPDVLAPVTGIPPYATVTGVVGLMLMHVVAVAVAVPVAQRISPAR